MQPFCVMEEAIALQKLKQPFCLLLEQLSIQAIAHMRNSFNHRIAVNFDKFTPQQAYLSCDDVAS